MCYMDAQYKGIEILTDDFKNTFTETDETHTVSVSQKTKVCVSSVSVNVFLKSSVKIARSDNNALRRSPNPGAQTAITFNIPRILFTISVAS